MNDVAFGQVYPVDSVIHSLDARMKMIATIAFIVLMFFVNTFMVYAVVAVCLFVVILLSRVPIFRVLKSISAVLILIVFTFVITALFSKGMGKEAEINAYGFYVEAGIFTICGTGLLSGAKLVCRILLLVLGPTMLTLTTTPVDITNAVEHFLFPLSVIIGSSVYDVGLVLSLALRLIPSMMEETQKIINAQKARGASFDHGNIFKRAAALLPVLIPLFVSAFNRADELADAMDSRCFNNGNGRTKYKVLHYRARDFVAYGLFAVFFFVVLNLCFNFFSLDFITAFTFI